MYEGVMAVEMYIRVTKWEVTPLKINWGSPVLTYKNSKLLDIFEVALVHSPHNI
jgi:hypothetical protein